MQLTSPYTSRLPRFRAILCALAVLVLALTGPRPWQVYAGPLSVTSLFATSDTIFVSGEYSDSVQLIMSLSGEGGERAYPVDVMLVVDSSAGVTAEGFEEQRAFMNSFVDALEELGYLSPSEVRVGIVDFTRSASLRQILTGNPQTLRSAIQKLRFRGASARDWGSNMSAGISRASQEFSVRRRGVARGLAIILSDGDWNQGEDPAALAEGMGGEGGIEFIGVLSGPSSNADRRRDVMDDITTRAETSYDITDGVSPVMNVFFAGAVAAATNLRLVMSVGNDFQFSSDEFFGDGSMAGFPQITRSSDGRSIVWTQESFDSSGSLYSRVYYRGPTTGKFPRTVPLAKSAVLTYVDPDGIKRTVKFAKINVTLVTEFFGTPGPVT